MFKILITDPVSDNGIKTLKDKGLEVFYYPDSDLSEIESLIQEADGWIIRSGTKIHKNF